MSEAVGRDVVVSLKNSGLLKKAYCETEISKPIHFWTDNCSKGNSWVVHPPSPPTPSWTPLTSRISSEVKINKFPPSMWAKARSPVLHWRESFQYRFDERIKHNRYPSIHPLCCGLPFSSPFNSILSPVLFTGKQYTYTVSGASDFQNSHRLRNPGRILGVNSIIHHSFLDAFFLIC